MYHSYYTCDLCGKRVDSKSELTDLRRLYGWRSLCVYYHPDLNKDRGKVVQFDICPECDVLMLTLPHVERVSEFKFDVTGEPTIAKVDDGVRREE
jgi:hypothetical protein